jgi:hypothetical protein
VLPHLRSRELHTQTVDASSVLYVTAIPLVLTLAESGLVQEDPERALLGIKEMCCRTITGNCSQPAPPPTEMAGRATVTFRTSVIRRLGVA